MSSRSARSLSSSSGAPAAPSGSFSPGLLGFGGMARTVAGGLAGFPTPPVTRSQPGSDGLIAGVTHRHTGARKRRAARMMFEQLTAAQQLLPASIKACGHAGIFHAGCSSHRSLLPSVLAPTGLRNLASSLGADRCAHRIDRDILCGVSYPHGLPTASPRPAWLHSTPASSPRSPRQLSDRRAC